MDKHTAEMILAKVHEKRADPAGEAFAGAMQNMANAQLKSDAMKDVGNLGMAALGVGLGGRGLVGLLNLLKQRPKKPRSGPALLPLPYPAEPKMAGFMGGDSATSKSGIPWYGPAMFFSGLAGLGAGWKGMDAVLDRRRRKELESQTNRARQEFNQAMMASYDHPIQTKLASDTTMQEVGNGLDQVFIKFATLLDMAQTNPLLKTAFDAKNMGGAAVGSYGLYAGLSGLLAGSLLYGKTKKRSQAAIIQKALQRRQRRQFMQQPTEIYATPVPVTANSAG